LTHFKIPKDVEFQTAMSATDCIYLTANHRNDLYKFDPDQTYDQTETETESEKLEFELVGTFTHPPRNVCLIDDVIYNFSGEFKPAIETYDVKKKVFKVVWEEESGTLEFSSNFSFGCFPLVKF
jgi:hypothetical protein